MNRMVAVNPATLAAVKAVHATASQLNSRRVTVSPSAFFGAAGRAGAEGPAAAASGAALCLSLGVMFKFSEGKFCANLINYWRLVR
jgi:hypothetical protein